VTVTFGARVIESIMPDFEQPALAINDAANL
jgi:hypothetical protein